MNRIYQWKGKKFE